MRSLPLALALLATLALAVQSAAAAVHPTRVGTFATPVDAAAPPGDRHRLFVVEKQGRIKVLRDGRELARPFLDISDDVTANGEQGLLSMAFARDYAKSRRVFVFYTAPRPGDSGGSVLTIQRLTTLPGNRNVADPASRRTLVRVEHPTNSNHNGGQLQIGPGGKLFASTGDGGSGNDPPNNAQNRSSRLGKLLRIDPSTGATSVYAYGLRNPWRFSFDRRTGDLIIGDVGQNAYEEVDFQRAGNRPGINYGWRCFEGFHVTGTCALNPKGTVRPVIEKAHDATGFCAIVGGYVVRDPTLTGLTGRYVYGDNCAPAIRSARLVAPPARVSDDRASGVSIDGLTSFGEDSCGHVYAVSGLGPVYRLDGDAFRPCPPSVGAGRDSRAPVLRLTAKRVQRVLRHRGVRIALRCNEMCGATSRATMRLAGSRKRYRLRPAIRQVASGRRVKATLRMSKRQRRLARRALRSHRRVRFRVRVTARDAAGNAARKSRAIRARL